MKKNFQDIKEAFDRLERTQTHHIASFDAELIPDLELQLIERKQEFNLLKENVDQWVGRDTDMNDDTKAAANYFTERIQTLLKQNETLKKKVRMHKDSLQQSLKNLSRGKQVIGAYGSPSSISNRPRAIDITTH
jgi:rubrerythrin